MTAKTIILGAALALAATPVLAMDLSSSDVTQGTSFDIKFVCSRYDGGNTSPALSWSGVPANAKSLAVTMFDPDAHGGGFYHWTLFDIPPTATGLTQGASSGKAPLPQGTVQGADGTGADAYRGPCPPAGSGVHHYQITLWALGDAKVPLDGTTKAVDVGAYMEKHAITKARIIPVYQK